MVAAGEDPRFIARRLIISASEDVGNADPHALQVAVAAAQALDWVGSARGAVRAGPGDGLYRGGAKVEPRRISLLGGHGRRPAATARCPCRPTCAARRRARRATSATGKGYVYPHDYVGADVDQQYLPDGSRAGATTSRQTTAMRRSSASAWPASGRASGGSRGRRTQRAIRLRATKVGLDEGVGQRHGPARGTQAIDLAARQKREAKGRLGAGSSRRTPE